MNECEVNEPLAFPTNANSEDKFIKAERKG
jgi:hypothetical protein